MEFRIRFIGKTTFVLSSFLILCSCATSSKLIPDLIKEHDKCGIILNINDISFRAKDNVAPKRLQKRIFPMLEELKKKTQSPERIKDELIGLYQSKGIKTVDIFKDVEVYKDPFVLSLTRQVTTVRYEPQVLKDKYNINYIIGINVDYGIHVPTYSNKIKKGYCRIHTKLIDLSSNKVVSQNETLHFVKGKKTIESLKEAIETSIMNAKNEEFEKLNRYD